MTESYPAVALREFTRLKTSAERAIAQVSDEQFFASPAPLDNSIAVIVKHMAGNLTSRWSSFLTSDGEKPGRNRDVEFEILPEDTRENLMRAWEQGWNALFEALRPLTDADMTRTITIRGEPLSVLLAINRQLTHYAYHVGQIVYVAKHYAEDSWKTLSIPRGGSAAFNRNPAKYA